jgi:hypothetical protein
MIKKLLVVSSLAVLLAGCGKTANVINIPELPVAQPSMDNSYQDFLKMEEGANTSRLLILSSPDSNTEQPVKKRHK